MTTESSMTAKQHIDKAEVMLDIVVTSIGLTATEKALMVARAQVHATLAMSLAYVYPRP